MIVDEVTDRYLPASLEHDFLHGVDRRLSLDPVHHQQLKERKKESITTTA